MTDDKYEELWTFYEPHASGGDCKITLTRRQAIEWTRSTRPNQYASELVSDDEVFEDFQVIHWAYPQEMLNAL